MDLTFKALQEDFTGAWPAVMDIENAEYTGTLFYAGVDPSDETVGEYAADLAAGRLDRKYLTATCEPKIRGRETELGIVQGRVVLRPLPVASTLWIKEARRLAADLSAAIGSAEALDDFLTARFGPAD